ncbi:MAG: hypothetical protein ACREAC_23600 [Blastocatellia bacterium]
MSIASEYSGFDWENLLMPHETWPSYFEEVFEQSPDAAEDVVRLLYEILDAIQSGPEGVAKTINSLKDGIEYAYQFTEAHKLGLKLYLLYMDGKLEPCDEPEHMLSRAVERGMVATKEHESGEEANEE